MKIVRMPRGPKTLVFDIDLTLYDNRAYYSAQAPLLLEKLAAHLRISTTEAEGEVRRIREAYARAHHGRTLSLGLASGRILRR